MDEILERARAAWPSARALLRKLVECESPSEDAAAVTRLMELLADETGDCARAKLVKMARAGRCLRLDFALPGPKRKVKPGLLAMATPSGRRVRCAACRGARRKTASTGPEFSI